KKLSGVTLCERDVLLNITGDSVARVCMVPDNVLPARVNQHVAIIRPNEKLLPGYLLYYLASPYMQAYILNLAVGKGASRNALTKGMIEDFPLLLPPIGTQKRIAEILSAYNDLIERNRKQIKLLEEAAQRLYKEWFVDLRFPGHESVPVINGVPEGWAVQSMNDIAEYINGYAFKPEDWGAIGKPIIKIKEMGSGITADTPRNTGKTIPEKYNVTAGDILFSWSATLSAMIWDEEDGFLNQHIFKVIPCEGISREFVLLSILKTLDEFSNLTVGSTMKHIQRGKLKEVKVNVPTTDLMEHYKNVSEPIREQILNVKRQIILLQEARDRLLPKLMSGEVEV
ncbi:MAG: restriction endonuclease subunit S, partial [Opitutales bacterium]|nr:restriction endonuclease subunit S [Opitutales bacterium]